MALKTVDINTSTKRSHREAVRPRKNSGGKPFDGNGGIRSVPLSGNEVTINFVMTALSTSTSPSESSVAPTCAVDG